MFSPLFLRELLSVLIILLHFLGLDYRTISSAELCLELYSFAGRRNNSFRYCSEEKKNTVPLRVPGKEPKLFVRPSGSLVAIPTEKVKKQHQLSLRTRFVMAVQWRQISKIWCVNHNFFLAALEILRKGCQV
jgi:hypothetical protein